MHRLILLALALVLVGLAPRATAAQSRQTITMIHFSDYHSHAVPFYAAGDANTAGIARALAYLKPWAADPNALIFSGGDTINKGTPAWSDKYQCLEWSWFNGIVDAMAFGNHDADYGADVFAKCQAGIDYPILSSNTLAADGAPLFQADGKTYRVFEAAGRRIGVFALAGADFDRLVVPAIRPAPGATFADRAQTAREVVRRLRDEEKVNAVVLIGHALYEDDVALAKAVPGIDVIFGTHSHRRQDLAKIDGTETWYVAPFQYLTYLSKIELSFDESGALAGVAGGLVRLDSRMPEDPEVAARVAQLQADLKADPQYAPLFAEIGAASVELSTDGQVNGEAVLGNLVMDVVRRAAGTQMALSTSSSFREPIPPGVILEEGVRTAMPYPNKVLIYALSGAQVQSLLDFSVSRRGSDFFAQVSGVRFNLVDGKAANVQLLRDAANPAAGYAPLDAGATYSVATTDFLANIAGGYKDLFANQTPRDPNLEVRDQFRAYVKANSPVGGQLDGRITLGPPPAIPGQLPGTGLPAALPATGGSRLGWWWLAALALGLGLAGGRLRLRARRG